MIKRDDGPEQLLNNTTNWILKAFVAKVVIVKNSYFISFLASVLRLYSCRGAFGNMYISEQNRENYYHRGVLGVALHDSE